MTSPLVRLIDEACRCTRCGATAAKGCGCWPAPAPTITLRCPGCGRSGRITPDHPDERDDLYALCPGCPEGHRGGQAPPRRRAR